MTPPGGGQPPKIHDGTSPHTVPTTPHWPPDTTPTTPSEAPPTAPLPVMAQPVPSFVQYTPKPGEAKEVFVCGGSAFYGYKASCPDYQKVSTEVREHSYGIEFLVKNGGRFTEWKNDDVVLTMVRHYLYNDGKGEVCKDRCKWPAIVGGGMGAFALVSGYCIAMTPAVCFGTALGFGGSSGLTYVGVTGGYEATRDTCIAQMCDG